MSKDMMKVPPNAVELEEAVIGALLIDGKAINYVADTLRPESFYREAHGHIFAAIQTLYAKGDPIDMLMVVTALKAMGKLEQAGGMYGISKMCDRVASSANIEVHARVIEDKAIQRDLIKVAKGLWDSSFEETSNPLDLLDTVTKDIEKVSGRLAHSGTGTASDLLRQVKEQAEKAALQKGIIGLQTGIYALDKLHGGRQDGHFIVMAGRPAMGKTSKALCEALHMAMNGAKVLFVSLEMGAVELMQRALSVQTGIELHHFRTGQLDPEQWDRVNAVSGQIAKTGLHIVDDLHTIAAIRSEARRMKERDGLDIIFVDYIQLVSHTLSGRSRENEVSEVSRSFKLMARSLSVPVVALSQLSRAVETRGGNKRPMLSDLRESGSIEQDADIVEFLYRPEYYGIDQLEGYETTQGLAFTIVAKNRHGGCADVPMKFHNTLTRFTDWDGGPTQRQEIQLAARSTAMRPNTNFYEKEDDDSPF